MGFMMAVAVAQNPPIHGELLVKVQSVNGYESTESTDLFKFSQLKDYSGGLTQSDLAAFIKWFIQAPLVGLKQKSNIQQKLLELKHHRMAWYHVMHPEGKSHPSKSVLQVFIRIKFYDCLQGPQRQCTS